MLYNPDMEQMQDHDWVQELARHEQEVLRVQKQAKRWRLIDCDEPTLVQMRHALIEEMLALEKKLSGADAYFQHCLKASDPLATDRALHRINRHVSEWEALNKHLQEVDEAVLERHLHTRLISVLGGRWQLAFVDTFIFIIIIVAVVLTLVALLVPDMPEQIIDDIDLGICIVLLVDFFGRMWLSEDRRWYLRRYWVDLVASIPLIGVLRLGRLLRISRFARLLRLLRLLRLGRAFRALTFNFRSLDKLIQTFQLSLLKRAVVIASILLLVGAFSMSTLENMEGATGETNVSEFQESFWWSFTTVATGGFVDLHNPVTPTGRFVTAALVLMGFAVTGIFTASLTSVLVEDDSSRIEQNQFRLEQQMEVVTQQLDLMSRETNVGLLALETVAQAISNGRTPIAIAQSLVESMTRDFDAIQASVHIMNPEQTVLQRLTETGVESVTPSDWVVVGEDGLLGRFAAKLLTQDLTTIDLEPEDAPEVRVQGIALACPLVAQGELLGMLHIVLPSNLGRYYLYNRAPMTLAHHTAIALYALRLA